jgi:hypothetical protein
MGRAELPVRIEKYALHVYKENPDVSGPALHELSAIQAPGDCKHRVKSKYLLNSITLPGLPTPSPPPPPTPPSPARFG